MAGFLVRSCNQMDQCCVDLYRELGRSGRASKPATGPNSWFDGANGLARRGEHKVSNEAELIRFLEVQYPRLVGLLGLYCGSREMAEELAQETLARACQHWRVVSRMDEGGAWVYRVAVNLANSHFRKRSAERRALHRLERPDDSYEDPDTSSSVAIRKAVSSLPPRQKTVLLLHYFADLSFPQIAQSLGCPEGTVKSLAHRAISKLRQEPSLSDMKELFHAK